MSMSHPDELESVMLEADQDHMEQRTSGSDHLHLRMNSSEDISSLSPDPMHSARVSPDRITDKIRSYINPTAGAETPEQSQHGTSPSPNASPQQLSASVMQQSPAVSTPASYNLPLPPPHDNHSSIQDMLPLPPPHHAPHDKRLDSLPPAAATALPTSFPMLDSLQCFSGNPLERSSDVTSKFDPALSSPTSEVSLIVVSGRFVCIRPSPSSSSSSSPAGSLHELQALLLGIMDAQFDFNSEQISFTWIDESGTSKDDEDHVVKQPMPNASGSLQDEAADVLTDLPGSIAHTLPLYLLGRDSEERWTFALDVSSCEEGFTRWLKVSCGLEVTMMEMRKLMPMLSREACAIAGQAISLCQWHDAHRFCPRCGSPTLPYLNGTRRTCAQDSSHKLYPRTDPVVIMLVESPDGHKALLGRGKRAGPGMYTALSGFVDQCESIEEAVAREVREEARVQVEGVQVLGSQPWPIGRFGGCELMIGCVAKASSYEILVNATEMDDVQWFERSDLAAAVQLYEENPEASLAEIQQFLVDTLGFWIPPPVTMAFHLVRSWVKAGRPFFAEPQAKL